MEFIAFRRWYCRSVTLSLLGTSIIHLGIVNFSLGLRNLGKIESLKLFSAFSG